jgi:hypothetical protein
MLRISKKVDHVLEGNPQATPHDNGIRMLELGPECGMSRLLPELTSAKG